jgi:hypothetical protein
LGDEEEQQEEEEEEEEGVGQLERAAWAAELGVLALHAAVRLPSAQVQFYSSCPG